MGRIVYNGGNCDGLHLDVGEGEQVPASVVCAGTRYDVIQLEKDTYVAILPEATHPPAWEGAPPATPVPLDKGVAEAWSEFRRAFHSGIPKRVDATRRAALRIRRVGR